MSQSYEFNITEGVTSKIESIIKSLVKDPSPILSRYVIIETISDPTLVDKNKIDYWKNVIGVANIQFAKSLSRNSIIAQKINTGITSINPPMFFLPFFSSHLSLPCKPGETVWAIFEDPNARVKEMGFWICKAPSPHMVDDVNHTHFPQYLDESFTESIIKKQQNKNDAVYELRNGKVNSLNGIRYIVNGSEYINIKHSKNQEVAFETLIKDSDAGKITQYESVPRFKKRPGDIAIEGSNNTLIVLGTDRESVIAEQIVLEPENQELFREKVPSLPQADLVGKAGSIDVVAGRGYSSATSGQTAVYKSLKNSQDLFETLEKKNPTQNEGDLDYLDDRSRVLVSQRISVDEKFKLSQYLAYQHGILDSGQDAAVVIKSDKIRLIARSDISLIVTDYTDEPDADKKSTYKKEKKWTENSLSNWASITIKRDGDIVFTPGDEGVIRLGGDDAARAILCTDRYAKIEDGFVKSLPIASTAGGFVGTAGGNTDLDAVSKASAPDLGTFSTKVLIK